MFGDKVFENNSFEILRHTHSFLPRYFENFSMELSFENCESTVA
jgi:hypothetical protein